jgi:hypothetical protein
LPALVSRRPYATDNAVRPTQSLSWRGQYEYHGPPDEDRWAVHAVDKLAFAHDVVPVIASVAVVLLTLGAYRWMACAAILVIGALTGLLSFGAGMATSGAYL